MRDALPTKLRDGAVVVLRRFDGVLPKTKDYLPDNDTASAPARFKALVTVQVYVEGARTAGQERTAEEAAAPDQRVVGCLKGQLHDIIRNFDPLMAQSANPKNKTTE